jgi:hypothetical protein
MAGQSWCFPADDWKWFADLCGRFIPSVLTCPMCPVSWSRLHLRLVTCTLRHKSRALCAWPATYVRI